MAFKQPRVPEYRESEGTGKYIRSLVLFLKDFCMDVWTANNQRSGEIDAVRGSMPKVDYPVTSVCGKTGEVALTAGDVGALDAEGTAADSSALCGQSAADILLAAHPVSSVYISFDPTSPAELFGGTWEAIYDVFLLAAGNLYENDSTGGEAEHTLTTDEMPGHGHLLPYKVDWGSQTGLGTYQAMLVEGTIYDTGSGGYTGKWHPYQTQYNGGDLPHNNMPPYIAVYMWWRVS